MEAGPHEYLQIVQNRREGKGVRHTVVVALGRLDRLAAGGAVDQFLNSGEHFAERLMVLAEGIVAEQDAAGRHNRLEGAGAVRIFTDIVSGASSERPELARLIDHARPGDSLCVTRLDRLGRSLAELLATVGELKARCIHLASLEERLISERTREGLATRRLIRRRRRRCASWSRPA